MRNGRLNEAQAKMKVARRNINSFRFADTTFMAKSEEEPKSLFFFFSKEPLDEGERGE